MNTTEQLELFNLDTPDTPPAAPAGWTGRADYAERREARIDRLEERAERHAEAATAAFSRAHAAVEGIPFGQPNIRGCLTPAINRQETAMRAGIRENATADRLAQMAEAARNNHAISSDDPEAVTRLKAKLAHLEEAQEKMKAVNVVLRMKDIDAGNAKLAEMGYNVVEIEKLRTPDFMGRIGFPKWALTNNGATIRNVKARIEQLERRAAGPAPEGWTFDGGEVICNVPENRLQVRFESIPDPSIRENLKRNGFRWSRFAGVWQRQLTPAAIRDARTLFLNA